MSTELLSDKNVVGRKAEIVSRDRPYSDLDLSLKLHPVFNDIRPLTDLRAVKNSVKNLILTNFNERPFQPKLGSNVRALLFENASPITIITIREEIERVLAKYEKRINQINVEVTDNSDKNAYHIALNFNVIAYDTLLDLELFLERVR
jgi:phage baseplate assembly protein W